MVEGNDGGRKKVCQLGLCIKCIRLGEEVAMAVVARFLSLVF